MDEATARARIEAMTAWDQEPQLTVGEVDDLVVIAARLDPNGVEPAEVDWIGTYDLSAAAAEGWRWKAGKVAGAFDFTSDGQRFDRGDKHAMCLQMADHYRKRILVSARIRGSQPVVRQPVIWIGVEVP